jgi:hypothetical protein
VDYRSGRTVLHAHPDAPDKIPRNNAAIAADGRAFAVGWRDGTVEVWNDRDSKPAVRWKAPFYANALSFMPGDRELLVNDDLLDLRTGTPSGRTFGGDFDAVNDIAYSADGHTAAASEADTSVRRFDLATGKETARFSDLLVEPFGIDIGADGKVVVGVASGRIQLLTNDLRPIASYAAPAGMGVYKVLARRHHVLAQLLPLAGDTPPRVMLLDLASGQWSAMMQLDDAVAIKPTAAGVVGFWLRGRDLSSRQIALPE